MRSGSTIQHYMNSHVFLLSEIEQQEFGIHILKKCNLTYCIADGHIIDPIQELLAFLHDETSEIELIRFMKQKFENTKDKNIRERMIKNLTLIRLTPINKITADYCKRILGKLIDK